MWETRVQPLGQDRLLEKEMAPHSSILAWRIPWTEEPGGVAESDTTERLTLTSLQVRRLSLGWSRDLDLNLHL